MRARRSARSTGSRARASVSSTRSAERTRQTGFQRGVGDPGASLHFAARDLLPRGRGAVASARFIVDATVRVGERSCVGVRFAFVLRVALGRAVAVPARAQGDATRHDGRVLNDGRQIAGRIRSYGARGVVIEVEGELQTVPTDQIAKMRFNV